MERKKIEKIYATKINELKKFDKAYFDADNPIISVDSSSTTANCPECKSVFIFSKVFSTLKSSARFAANKTRPCLAVKRIVKSKGKLILLLC